jgi:hypothetical protein
MIPPKQRQTIKDTIDSASSWTKSIASFGGNALWIISTSVLLLGAPWAMAFAEDQQIAEEEQRMKEHVAASEVSILIGNLVHIWTPNICRCSRQMRVSRRRLACETLRSVHSSLLNSCIVVLEGCHGYNKLPMDILWTGSFLPKQFSTFGQSVNGRLFYLGCSRDRSRHAS